ncbi:uncharacterized protein PHACADRAFT_252172 [Phanerochaete carnosa HHB-10118-sp]|uniref:Uncharacterized protein n=1 Tax=Phanerochaete carnosa (strain HHB-10118-sp) TaxID=650164 RepID=K5X5I3_PHACS|nr:uncharacterized protein PHACADRAFT_252172 [Phanerochaete carnosa HHB-10118-sp]EKM58122.1 hypothetical protein PHACADRAFT_252172 [Phanerochaete carnosa HHB-10118-sp]
MAAWMLIYTSSTIPGLLRLASRASLLPWHPRILPQLFTSGKIFASSLSLGSLDTMPPSMVAMSQQNTPSSGWDGSLFEDVSEDYTEQDAIPAQSPSMPQNSSEALAQLIERGDFVAAIKVKKTLEKLGIPIQRDACYVAAAADVLYRYLPGGKRPLAKRIYDFNSWATLVPASQAVQNDSYFQSIAWTSSQAGSAAFQRSALKVAHMGLARKVARVVVAQIARQNPPHITIAFMSAFAAADRAATGNDRRNKVAFKRLYGLAIRTLCLRGLNRDAVKLLRDARNRGYRVNRFTLSFLSVHLRAASDPKQIQFVEKEIRVAESVVRTSVAPSETSHEDPAPLASRHQLLHRLRTAIARGHLPSRYALNDFIRQCVRYQDHATYEELFYLFKTHRNRSEAINYWASVEIAYYLRVGEEHAACQVFTEFFRITDLPGTVRKMLRIVDRGGRHPLSHFTSKDAHSEKIWPDARVSFLFWRILVRIMQPGEIGKVYGELNSRFSSARERLSFFRNPLQVPPGMERKRQKELADLATLRPANESFPYTHNHFLLFLRAYARINYVKGIVKVVRRLGRLGWRPRQGDIRSITQTYARGGSAKRVAPLLDRLGRDAERYKHSNEVGTSSRTSTHLGMYRAAIRAMMDNSRYADAGRLARHLQRRLKYKPGSDVRTDRLLNKLYGELRKPRSERKLL